VNSLEAEQIFLENLYLIKGKVLIVLPKPWQLHSAEEITLLTKILGSVKLSLEAVQIIYKEDVTLSELSIYQPSAIILFGVNFTPSIKSFSSETIDGITIIHAEALSSLDDSKKKNLWGALKHGFKL
jgi:hypothetical protein